MHSFGCAAQEPAGDEKLHLEQVNYARPTHVVPGSQGDCGMLHCGIVLLTVRASAPKSAVHQP